MRRHALAARATQAAERNRVAQAWRRRDGVLPAPARFVAQRIDRARCKVDAQRAPARSRLVRIAAQPHTSGPQQGNADDELELRHVAVPAKLRAGGVFGHERVAQRLVLDADEPGCRRAQLAQERRHRRFGQQLVAAEVVPAAVAHDAAVRGPLLVPRLRERQLLDRGNERRLLLARKELLPVAEAARRPLGRDGEQIGLANGHRPHWSRTGR